MDYNAAILKVLMMFVKIGKKHNKILTMIIQDAGSFYFKTNF